MLELACKRTRRSLLASERWWCWPGPAPPSVPSAADPAGKCSCISGTSAIHGGRAAPRYPHFARSHGLLAHSAPVFYAAEATDGAPGPRTVPAKIRLQASSHGIRPRGGVKVLTGHAWSLPCSNCHARRGTEVRLRGRAGLWPRRGIRDPHRVSNETVAHCDARAAGTAAGQPQNGQAEARSRQLHQQ